MLKFTISLVYLSLSYIFASAIKRNTKNINIMITFETIKNTADNRSTETLKQDLIVAYKSMISKNNDVTKTIYHAINEVLMSRMSETELDEFELTYKL